MRTTAITFDAERGINEVMKPRCHNRHQFADKDDEMDNMKPKYHAFRQRDCGEGPLGLGRMSARDRWRYAQSRQRFTDHYGEPPPLFKGEIGSIDGFMIITSK